MGIFKWITIEEMIWNVFVQNTVHGALREAQNFSGRKGPAGNIEPNSWLHTGLPKN